MLFLTFLFLPFLVHAGTVHVAHSDPRINYLPRFCSDAQCGTDCDAWWITGRGCWPDGQETHSCNDPQATLEFNFTGISITWFAITYHIGGPALVLLDGVEQGKISTYSERDVINTPVWSASNLSHSQHTLTIKCNPKSERGNVQVYAFEYVEPDIIVPTPLEDQGPQNSATTESEAEVPSATTETTQPQTSPQTRGLIMSNSAFARDPTPPPNDATPTLSTSTPTVATPQSSPARTQDPNMAIAIAASTSVIALLAISSLILLYIFYRKKRTGQSLLGHSKPGMGYAPSQYPFLYGSQGTNSTSGEARRRVINYVQNLLPIPPPTAPRSFTSDNPLPAPPREPFPDKHTTLPAMTYASTTPSILSEDIYSLSPRSTVAPLPPLSGSPAQPDGRNSAWLLE